VSKLDKSNDVNDEHLANIDAMSFKLGVLKLDKFKDANFEQLSNIEFI
jgi:hypothetical protein